LPSGVEPELSEADRLRLRSRASKQLKKIVPCWAELAIGRQRDLVNVGLCAHDRFVIEAGESCRDSLDFGIELIIGDHSINVSVLLCARSIEIVGDEEDFECPAATDQPRKARHWAATRNHAHADLPLSEKRVLARGESQIAGEHELASGTAGLPRIEAMPTTGARARRTRTSTQADSPVGPTPSAVVLLTSFSKS